MATTRFADLAGCWRDSLLTTLQQPENAAPLKDAALAGKLGEWTRQLTAVIVQSCQRLGWRAAAKGFALDLLPQIGQEYLGMDVMAFDRQPPTGVPRWCFPVAVFELENSRNDDRVAYSLWKVLCLDCPLRAVFAYRDDWLQARDLVHWLARDVVGAIPPSQVAELRGQTLLVVGSRGEGETFPWGYFKIWGLDANSGGSRRSDRRTAS
jgi:hypothetical protein